jgi:hypothetical protein
MERVVVHDHVRWSYTTTLVPPRVPKMRHPRARTPAVARHRHHPCGLQHAQSPVPGLTFEPDLAQPRAGELDRIAASALENEPVELNQQHPSGIGKLMWVERQRLVVRDARERLRRTSSAGRPVLLLILQLA